MRNIDVKEIDRNMAIKDNISDSIIWMNPLNKPFKIYGFPWLDKDGIYKRIKKEINLEIPEAVENLAYHTAGGQIKFKTDSSIIAIKVYLRNAANMYHMAATGQCGFDLYMGYAGEKHNYCSTVKYDQKKDFYQYELYNNPEDKRLKDVLINFPLYEGVKEVEIGIENHSCILPADDFKYDKRIVFYGTSITQGGCASRPGMCYTNILSRMLEAECINLGFAGNGKGEMKLAQVINKIDNKGIIVVDYEPNCISTDLYKETLPKFIETLRKADSNIPIVVLSRPLFSKDLFYRKNIEDRIKRNKFAGNLVENLNKSGDKKVYYLDMASQLQDDFYEATVDGVHPTDYGFAIMAQIIYRKLKEIIQVNS